MGWLPGGYCPSLKWTGVMCRPEHIGELQHRKYCEVAVGESGDREVQVRVAGKLKQLCCARWKATRPQENSFNRVRCRWDGSRTRQKTA